MKELEELKAIRNKLYTKALKQFPNSPLQLKTREEIEKINGEIKVLECFAALRG